jgi:addiction module HigA family antidote
MHKRLLEPIHPGEILFEEFMKPIDIIINRLAREIHVSPARISAIVNGKRAVTADTLHLLAERLRVFRDDTSVCQLSFPALARVTNHAGAATNQQNDAMTCIR